MIRRSLQFVLLVVTVNLVSCQDTDQAQSQASSDAFGPTSLLRYVPGDTPYVYASLSPLDPGTYNELRPRLDAILDSIGQVIAMVMEADSDEPDAALEPAVLTNAESGEVLAVDADDESEGFELDDQTRKLLSKIQSLMSVSALEDIGFGRTTLLALYGDEFRPVLRIRSDKPDRLRATAVDLLGEAGVTFDSKSLGEQEYGWFAGDSWSVLLATVAGDLVVSLVPTDASADSLQKVLGLSLPEESLADTGRLASIALDAQYLPFGLGYLDIRQSTAMLLELDPALRVADLGEFLDPPQDMSPACVSELLGVAETAPLYRFGLTELSGERMNAEYLLELKPELAAGLASMVAPVPGLGQDLGGLFFFGYSFDLFAAKQFALDQIAVLEADPFECEQLSWVQDMVGVAKEAVGSSLPPLVSSVKGVSMVLDEIGDLDLEALEMVPFKARMVASLDNPLSLLAMSSMVLPALASVPLEDNGLPVQLPDGAIPMVNEPVFLAVGESAVSLTVGATKGDAATALLQGEVDPDPPLYSYGVDLGAFMSLLGDFGRSKGDEMTAEDEAALKVLDAFTAMDLRYTEALRFTDSGMRYDVALIFD